MDLSLSSITLLKFVASYDGKKEVNADGKEVDSPRRLNNEESAQRRFFLREVARVEEETKPALQAIVDGYNKFLEEKKTGYKTDNPRAEKETDEEWNKRILSLLENDQEVKDRFELVKVESLALNKKIFSLNLTQKTVDFLKKYFQIFGDEVGFLPGDDEAVQELNQAFGL
jgi:hypothetical protein